MTIKQIYEKAEFDLDKNKITIGEFAKIIGQEVVIIPDNATNGDMIKALFDCKVVEETHSTYVVNMGKDYFWKNFEKSWWNAPYKKGEQE